MTQGVLPFQYQEEQSSGGMTALAGLPTYLELAHIAGVPQSIARHVKLREGKQGWSDTQVITSLVLLNLAGGECVEDLGILEKDEGFGQLLWKMETYGMARRERRAFERRFRKERSRAVPSPSAVFRYIGGFHNEREEEKRQAHKAFIPAPNEALRGLGKVNAELISFVQSRGVQKVATLDQDATLIETTKKEALYGYKGFKSYQPLSTYWAEQDLVLHSEFRDGNVPAGYEQLRVFREAVQMLPEGVLKLRLRSDTAGYQKELLKFCAEGKDERFGVIEFAVGVDVTPEFKKAVAEVDEKEWHVLERLVDGKRVATDQEWAEVCFVPNWVAQSKKGPDYRYLGIREPLKEPAREQELPFATWDVSERGSYKLFGVVTNRTIPGDELIRWHRERCGKGEEVHGVMKQDLAGGKLPSAEFGKNAAWWAIVVLAFNLNSAMKHLVLGTGWVEKRLKAIRFGFISLAGRLIRHARGLYLRLSGSHPSFEVLLSARRRIMMLGHSSS